MKLTGRQLHQLTASLNPNRVASRKQGSATLSYIEAWDARAAMIRIFGYGGWSAETKKAEVLRIDEVERAQPTKSGQTTNFRVLATVTMEVTIKGQDDFGSWATYSETAAASQIGPDIGEVTDFAIKTAASDAFKRCVMNLGTQFGLSLYDNGSFVDVVKVVLEPDQREALEQFKAEAERRKQFKTEAERKVAGAAAPTQAALQKVADDFDPSQVDPDTGEVFGETEDDYSEVDEGPMAMVEPSEEARGSVRQAFKR